MRTGFLVFALFVAGCVRFAAAPGYIGPDEMPTAQAAARLQYKGFSVDPPRTSGWTVRVTEQTAYSALFRRDLSSKTHSFLARVDLFRMRPGIPFEEAARHDRVDDTSRFDLLEYAQQPDESRHARCIRYTARLLDKEAPNSPGVPLEYLERGLTCAHPTLADTAVRLSCSERGLSSELDPSLWRDCERFTSGVWLEGTPGVRVD
jgi:hypothetical protein